MADQPQSAQWWTETRWGFIRMHRDAVYKLVKENVPRVCTEQETLQSYDPLLIMAIFEQESVTPGNPFEYRQDARRLEEGFFLKYTEKLEYEAIAETLFAISWGFPQLMGESLREMDYFQPPAGDREVTDALGIFIRDPVAQVEYAVRWFDKKVRLAHGDLKRALLLWNGGGDPDYPQKVYTRFTKLRGIYEPDLAANH